MREEESSASDSYSDSDYDDEGGDDGDDGSDDSQKGRYQSYLDIAGRNYLHEGYGWESDD